MAAKSCEICDITMLFTCDACGKTVCEDCMEGTRCTDCVDADPDAEGNDA